jgi:hypothetical protein
MSVKTWLLSLAALAVGASAHAAPLARYFPDNALAILEANDLQVAVKQTGSFGEETIRMLGTVLSETGNLGLGAFGGQLTARVMISSLRDVSAAVYSNVRNDVDYLVVGRFERGNFVTRSLEAAFQEDLKNPRQAKLREGAYVASLGEITAGMGNGLMYLSTNPDLLRAYLKRIQGQNAPVLTDNAAYRAAMNGVGDGFLRWMLNFSSAAQVAQRSGTVPPRALAVLRTLNLASGAMRVTAQGAETKSLTLLNANGGDAALYKLLTFTPEKLQLLEQLPANAAIANVLAMDTSGWLDYLGSWLGEAGLTNAEQRAARDTLATLRARLGNEWGVVSSGAPIPDASSLGVSVLGLSESAALLELLKGNQYFASTKDGNQVLNDLEVALQDVVADLKAAQQRADAATAQQRARSNTQDSEESSNAGSDRPNAHRGTRGSNLPKPSGTATTPPPASASPETPVSAPVSNDPTLERVQIAGFPALAFVVPNAARPSAPPTLALYIVNKNNTVVIGTDRAWLEQTLTGPALTTLPAFNAVPWPAKTIGVQFASPLKRSRDQIENYALETLLSLGIEERDVSERTLTIIADWFESAQDRSGVTYGYSVVNGNRLEGTNVAAFRWQ